MCSDSGMRMEVVPVSHQNGCEVLPRPVSCGIEVNAGNLASDCTHRCHKSRSAATLQVDSQSMTLHVSKYQCLLSSEWTLAAEC